MGTIKNFLLRICLVSAFSVYAVDADATKKVITAIESGDYKKVVSLMEKLDTTGLSEDDLKQLYGTLYDAAAWNVDRKADSIGYFGSVFDIAQTSLGFLATIIGGTGACVGYLLLPGGDPKHWSRQEKNRVPVMKKAAYGGAALSLIGLYIASRGLNCTTQHGWLKSAKAIEQYCEEKYRNVSERKKNSAEHGKQ